MTCIIRLVSALPAALMSPKDAGQRMPMKSTGSTDVRLIRITFNRGMPSNWLFWKDQLLRSNSQKP